MAPNPDAAAPTRPDHLYGVPAALSHGDRPSDMDGRLRLADDADGLPVRSFAARVADAARHGTVVGVKWGCALLIIAAALAIILMGINDIQQTRQGARMGAQAWQFIADQQQRAAQAASVQPPTPSPTPAPPTGAK